MELVFGIGALLLLAAIIYGTNQSKRRREERGIVLPEEKVDRKDAA
ncbi:MAG: hypothetical protein K0R27_3891 [Xanthobacteraceae bacterium]|jgi:hypothetical protein|nr:hypothetical protein [Xanthobacteraceae bacterium]